MRKNRSAGISLIIAAILTTVTASFFTIGCVRTKGKAENLNAASGKAVSGKEENARSESLAPNMPVIEIKEKMFAAQVNDVYLNIKDYLGKTIKLEGIFKSELYQGKEEPYCFVVRYGPGGCCGLDANVGFEVAWAKEKAEPYPAAESWVEATGVLKTYEEDGYSQYLYLDLFSLKILNKRGAETVLQ